jgi:hypothetical protein
MPEDPCKDVTPQPPRPDTKKLTGACAKRTNCDIGPQDPDDRHDTAREVRVAAAEFEHDIDPETHPCNCDEVRYQNQNFFASFTKGLKKIDNKLGDKFGEVDPDAYCALLAALKSGKPNDFENIPLGCTGAHKHPPGKVKQVEHEHSTRFAPGPMGMAMPMMQIRLTNPQSAVPTPTNWRSRPRLNSIAT